MKILLDTLRDQQLLNLIYLNFLCVSFDKLACLHEWLRNATHMRRTGMPLTSLDESAQDCCIVVRTRDQHSVPASCRAWLLSGWSNETHRTLRYIKFNNRWSRNLFSSIFTERNFRFRTKNSWIYQSPTNLFYLFIRIFLTSKNYQSFAKHSRILYFIDFKEKEFIRIETF